MKMTPMQVILLFWVIFSVRGDESSETEPSLQPKSAYIFESGSTHLTFSFNRQENYTVRWQLVGFEYGLVDYKRSDNSCIPSGQLFSRGNYSVVCNETAVSVEIRTVHNNSGDEWRCRFYSFATNSISYVYVGVRLKYVNITIDSPMTNENSTMNVTCLSSLSRPNATITLFKSVNSTSETEFPRNDTIVRTHYNETVDNLWQTVSTFTFLASRFFNNEYVFCSASNDPGKNMLSEKKHLNIQYPPKGSPVINRDFENGSNYLIIEQQVYVLKCSIDESNPPAVLTWTCDEAIRITSENSSSSEKSITCVSVSRKNAHCSCESKHVLLPVKSVWINMISLYKPGIPALYVNENALKSLTFIENTTVIVKCLSDGNPKPNITWYQNDSIISYDQELKLVQVNRTRDGEVFTCISKNFLQDSNGYNETGTSNKTIPLEVLYPPSVTKLNKTSVVEGKKAVILCQAEIGKPINMSFRWTNETGAQVSPNESLSFENISRKDSQNYTCAVNNTMTPSDGRQKIGFSNSSFELEVLFPVEKVKAGLKINEVYVNYISKKISLIETPQLLVLNCSAEGNPIPVDFTWTGSLENRSSIIQMTALRTIAGNYTCIAKNTMIPTDGNEQTSQMNETYEIDILFPPKIGSLKNKRVIEGDSFNTFCNITQGNPQNTTVMWSSIEGALISKTTNFDISQISRNNETLYICSASNVMIPTYGTTANGSTNSSFYLEVLYPPEDINVSLTMLDVNEDDIVRNFSLIENKSELIVFNCSAHGKPIPKNFTWYGKKGNSSSVLVLNLSREVGGPYTCSASNTLEPTNGGAHIRYTNQTYEVDILYPPEPCHLQKEIIIIEGQHLNSSCKVESGNPHNTDIKWTTNDHIISDTSVLFIPNVTRNNESIYVLTVNNTMKPTYGYETNLSTEVIGLKNASFFLQVLYPPEDLMVILNMDKLTVANVSSDLYLIENSAESFALNCTAQGKPSPTEYSWTGKSINNSETLVLIMNKGISGNYTCTAKNEMNPTNGTPEIGLINKTYVIEMLYPPEIENIQDNKVIEGQDYKIDCLKTSGKTTFLSVKWIKDNNETSVRPDSSLIIRNVSRNQNGRYDCFIQYKMEPTYGKNTSGNINNSCVLDVLYPPELLNISLKVDSEEVVNITRSVSVIENTSLVLNCSSLGNPLPSNYIWTGHQTNIPSATLPLKVTRILRGNFTCTAKNKMDLSNGTSVIGQTSQTFEIDVQYPPQLKEERYKAIPEGKDVNLTCVLDYGRTVHSAVRWISNNGTTIQQNSLIFVNVTRSSSGNYSCETNYTMAPSYRAPITGSIVKTVYLEVTYAKYDEQNSPPGGDNAGQVAGGVIGGLLGIGAVVAAVFLVRRRGFLRKAKNDDGGHHEYQNVGFTGELKQSKRLPALPPEEESEDVHGDHRTLVQQQQQQDYDADEHPYLNTMELIDLMKKVNVSDLFSYVSNKSYQEFSDEFGKFPSGLMVSIPCSIASRPQNAPLNRYQGIYPYDHSRVIISGQPDFFINASYIDGYSGEHQYIASLGPTVKHTLGFRTFWNMVWHQGSDVIVMLTNLQEPSGMKCEKYWADKGTTRNLGDFTIQSIDEEVAAEYKVRTFKVFKGDESRTVTQLHYTAWPDKKVPEDVTSLIEFRQRVKAAPTRSNGPLIVHCSAGVGRTGTYIALDRLIKEGKSKNTINVFDCVMNMRKQRVNMVQTLDQYVYLHQALVYCLVFDIEPVSSNGIDEYVKKTSNNVYSKLFQQLQQTVEDETIEEKEARARNGDMLEKNRTTADIPSDAHRIRLFLDKQMGESDYINAVYLNGFKRQEHFIIAQSPLPTTLDDFVCLIYQATCCCIVSLDDNQQTGASNVTYLPPDNQPMKYGTFTISCSNLDVKSGYSVRKLKLGFTGQVGKGERIVYHFEFTGWKHDDRTPKDPKLFVDFIKEVDKYATQLEDEHSHVLVHCMSGSERSGLFCAVYNLMDKMEQERQVSVVNMLRRVRARRRTAIPNMEQLKFCFQALNSFVKSYKI